MHTLSSGNCQIRDSIVVSISACHADDQGSIPCRGVFCSFFMHFQRFFSSQPQLVLRATDALKLQIARAEAKRKAQAGLLKFDYEHASDSDILEWHSLYTTELAAIQYRSNLLKFGRMALKQINQNRIPVDTKLTTGLPPELLLPNVADDAVVQWFSQVIANFKESDTSAMQEFQKPRELTPQQQKKRLDILQYFREHSPELQLDDLSLPVLQTMKKQHATDSKAAKAQQLRDAREEKRKTTQQEKYYQQLHQARKKASHCHKRGKITSFDYREADDATILTWYEAYKTLHKERR